MFLNELLDMTNDRQEINSSVEAYLRDDFERKERTKQRLLAKLKEQKRINEQKKKYIEK